MILRELVFSQSKRGKMVDSEKDLGIGSRVKHPEFGDGVVINIKPLTYLITFMSEGTREVAKSYNAMEVREAVDPDGDLVSLLDIKMILTRILRDNSDIQEKVKMGNKWTGGKMVLTPGSEGLASKEIPIDTFFKKIVMVRDRLRVMEQRINSSSNLSEEEKINLQQYLTRIYGSLTTFNVLFEDKEHHFVGEKSK